MTIDLNGYTYRSTVAVMGGRYMIGVSSTVRTESGLAGGDPVHVILTVDTAPREVDLPTDLETALADSGTRAFFDTLANSLQRYHIDNINAAKTPDTRARRIVKSVELFRNGEKR